MRRQAFVPLVDPARRSAGKLGSRQSHNHEGGRRGHPKIAFLGHFGCGNFGNEATLQAILYNLRRLIPGTEFTCICGYPESVASDYDITAVPSRRAIIKPWSLHNPLARLARKLIVGIPSELYRYLKGFKTLRGAGALIIPGTGLLTDVGSLFNWGPFDIFRWSVTAKLCRCKLFFVSVGAGPLYRRAGRFFVKAALSLADFRSYRDQSSLQYLKSIGFRAQHDPVYPDLVFSLPATVRPRDEGNKGRRLVVGLGLMEYAGKYSVPKPTNAVYSAYLEALVQFVSWLLAHRYDVRLLIGSGEDTPVTREFRELLKQRSVTHEEERIIDEPVGSVQDLMSQLAATDLVVATRFHNVLLALLLNKPAIAISFHHKCASLMSQMGLSEYCQDINDLNAEKLIEQFRELDKNSGRLRSMISEKVEGCRIALDEQYGIIIKTAFPGLAIPEGSCRRRPTGSGRMTEPIECLEKEANASWN
jgi:polysaccharide pyruvyl transferase WcaK-like protein